MEIEYTTLTVYAWDDLKPGDVVLEVGESMEVRRPTTKMYLTANDLEVAVKIDGDGDVMFNGPQVLLYLSPKVVVQIVRDFSLDQQD